MDYLVVKKGRSYEQYFDKMAESSQQKKIEADRAK